MLKLVVQLDNDSARFDLCKTVPELRYVKCNTRINWNNEATYDNYQELGNIKFKFKKKTPDRKYTITFEELECNELSFKDNTSLVSISGTLPRLAQGSLDGIFENCTALCDVGLELLNNNSHQLSAKRMFKNCIIYQVNYRVLSPLTECKDLTECYRGCRAIRDTPSKTSSLPSSVEVIDRMFMETPYLCDARDDMLVNNPNIISAKYLFKDSGIRSTGSILNFQYHHKLLYIDGLYDNCVNLIKVDPNYFAYLPMHVTPEIKRGAFLNVPAKINI